MGFIFKDTGEAASVYLGVYVIYLAIAIYILFQRGIKNAYTALSVYGLVRIGGQISGIGFAVNGGKNINWLVAYLILSAEGYVALVLSSMYLLIVQEKKWLGESAIADRLFGLSEKGIIFKKRSTKGWFHIILLVANALIIAGNSILGHMNAEDLETDHTKVLKSKILRTIGQSAFIIAGLAIGCLVIRAVIVKKLRNKVMLLLILVIPFITMRGIFGILSIYIDKMNYLMISNYLNADTHRDMTIYEYVLGTSMEFITAAGLLATHWFDTKKVPEEEISSDKTDV